MQFKKIQFKEFKDAVGKTILKVVLTVGLTLIYVLGIGFTALCRRLGSARKPSDSGYWRDSKPFVNSIESLKRQS